MRVELITREDLESFKKELFEEIRRYSPYMRKSGGTKGMVKKL